MQLTDICHCIDGTADLREQLLQQRSRLAEERKRLDRMIATVDRTVASLEGSTAMRDADKFEGFKQALVADNERTYGDEVRATFGDATADETNERILGM